MLVLAVLLVLPAETRPLWQGWGRSLYIATFLFLLRDIGLLLGFNLSRNQRRADIAVFVYWVVLYTVLPGMFYALDAPLLTAFFWPWAGEDAVTRILPAACQVVLMGWWVGRRWGALRGESRRKWSEVLSFTIGCSFGVSTWTTLLSQS